jgi:L-amino acid N-acyltransferase YncA
MSRQIYKLRTLLESDWRDVARIYREGIQSGHATFETEVPSWERWDASHLTFARLVLTVEETVEGWAALSKVSARQVYSGVAEVSVYVASKSQGHGFGHALLEALINKSESNGIWTLQASIFPENGASIRLHQKCGFREVGRRERIAQLGGVWRDTVLLERRSAIAGKQAKELISN